VRRRGGDESTAKSTDNEDEGSNVEEEDTDNEEEKHQHCCPCLPRATRLQQPDTWFHLGVVGSFPRMRESTR
jgi:hypothetical protein